jgi:alpha-L-arabinofuranosidase
VLQAMILTHKEKMLLTPTYHVFRLYLPFQDATALPTSVSAEEYQHGDFRLPRADAIAARDAKGKIWLAVANLDPNRSTEVIVDAPGSGIRQARGETLSAPRVDSVNTFDAPETVAPKAFQARASGGKVRLQLAPASITVVSLE